MPEANQRIDVGLLVFGYMDILGNGTWRFTVAGVSNSGLISKTSKSRSGLPLGPV